MPRLRMVFAERWDAVTERERVAVIRHGYNPAPWESPPDYAARILKFDPKISLDGGRAVATILRAAYEAMVAR